MTRPNAAADPYRPYLVFGSLLLATALLYWTQKVLIPVALAVLLAFIMTPAVIALQRRGLGRIFSVLLVVTLAFLLLGGVGWVLSMQIGSLAGNLAHYQGEITNKIQALRGAGEGGVWAHVRDAVDGIIAQLSENTAGPTDGTITPGSSPEHPVYVQAAPSGWSQFLQAAGPAAEGLASAFLVLVLVVFMLVQRENLRNRVVRLLGSGNLVATTRAIDEGARRISRYLIMQVCVNALFGVALTVGLVLIGLWSHQPALGRYALLWGFVAGSLRFVPYLGTWLAAALIFIFHVAALPGWGLTAAVLLYFVALELATANVVEPLLFGHSTGVSPLALLMAAAFWTWLWGPVGLVLSTPLTAILVVLGKYVPQLEFFEVLLGDEPALNTEVTYYQRLLARDQDEASELIEDFLQTHPVEAVYEEILLPTLVRAKRDRAVGVLEADDFQFLLAATAEALEDLTLLEQDRLPVKEPEDAGAEEAAPKVVFLGCPARDEADELALQFFQRILRPLGYSIEVLSSHALTAEVLERAARERPAVVCVAALPPGGLAQARYLCKRLRAQCPGIKIVVGRWGEVENLERVQKRLRTAGADYVATTLVESRQQIVPLLQVAAAVSPPAELPHEEQGSRPEMAHSG